jgi:hypothetical protein
MPFVGVGGRAMHGIWMGGWGCVPTPEADFEVTTSHRVFTFGRHIIIIIVTQD